METFIPPFPLNPMPMARDDQLAIYLTEAIATYMQAKFHKEIKGSHDHVPFPSDWDLTLLQECDRVIGILVEAYHNRCMKYQQLFYGYVISNKIFL